MATEHKRRPGGGKTVTFWANSEIQAKLERAAREQGLSLNALMRAIVSEWAKRQP